MSLHPSLEEVTQAAVDLTSSLIGPTLASITAYYASSDTAASRNVPLPVPVIHFGEPDSTGFARPAIFIYAPDRSLSAIGNQDFDQGNAEFTVTLFVEAHLASDSTDTVERQYSRFAEALETIFYSHPELGGTAVSVQPRRVERVRSNQPYVRVLRMTLSVLVFSNY